MTRPSHSASAGRGRQLAAYQVAKQVREHGLRREPEHRADQRDRDRHRDQLRHCLRKHEALCGAHALHQRGLVEMTRGVPARRHGHRNRGEEHAHQARERQEPARALGGIADLRARVRERLQPLARLLVCEQVGAELRDLGRIAGKELGAADPAAGLDQLRGLHIGQVDEQGGRQIAEAHALVRAIVEHLGDHELVRSDADPCRERSTESSKQPRIGPGLAARRDGTRRTRRSERPVGDPQLSAQRISLARGPQRDQRGFLSVIDDARHRREPGRREPAPLGLSSVPIRDRSRGFQPKIGGQHAARLLRHRSVHAAGEESHGGERGYGEEQCQQHHGQLA